MVGENKPKILFNYKTPNKERLELIKSVKSTLKKDFGIIDISQSKETDWQVNFIKYLGCCDGVVIFLDNDILSQSQVNIFETEIIILSWRHWIEDLPISIIAFDERVKEEFIKRPIWSKLSFQEEDIISCSSSHDPSNLLLNKFKNIEKNPVKALHAIQQDLENLLTLDDCTIQLQHFLHEISSHSWGGGISISKQIACEFIKQGLNIFLKLLSMVTLRKDKYKRILEISRLSSVELSKAGLIAKILKCPEPRDIFYINGNMTIATTYIQKALHSKNPSDGIEPILGTRISLKWIQITNIIDPLDDICTELLKNFTSIKNKISEYDKKALNDKINEYVKTYLDNKNFVFIVLVNNIDHKVLKTIKDTYPYLLIVCFSSNTIDYDKNHYLEISVSEEQNNVLSNTYGKCSDGLNMLFD